MTAVLFDLDGTLVDSRPGIFASLHAMLRGLGHEVDPGTDYTWAVGPPLEQSISRILAEFGDDRVTAGARLYREHYGAGGLLGTTLFPGIAEALTAMARHQLFVVTGKRRVFAQRILERLMLADPSLRSTAPSREARSMTRRFCSGM